VKTVYNCLEFIQSQKIQLFVKEALSKADPHFWLAPCSGTGKYDPPENQAEGGIIVHIIKGAQIIISLCRFFDITDQSVKDKLFAAFILHDIWKFGRPWGKSTHPEHGLIAAEFLTDLAAVDSDKKIIVDPDLADIIEMVKNHMGRWSKPDSTPALKTGKMLREKMIWHLIIQMADFWSTRKWCSFTIEEFSE